jgi:hypothetical protein
MKGIAMQATLERAKKTLNDATQAGVKGVVDLANNTERAIAKVPPGVYLGFGVKCCIASTVLHLLGQKKAAHAVGSWAPVAMLLGVYSKMERHMNPIQEELPSIEH